MTTSSAHPPQEIEAAWQLHESLSRYRRLLWDRYEPQFQSYLEAKDFYDDLGGYAYDIDDDIPF